jgi:hypothetical protein
MPKFVRVYRWLAALHTLKKATPECWPRTSRQTEIASSCSVLPVPMNLTSRSRDTDESSLERTRLLSL